MECIGANRTGVVSLASDLSGGPVVVSLDELGAVRLWDTRSRQKNPPTFTPADVDPDEDACEIAYFPEVNKALTLGGPHVRVFDVRTNSGCVETYQHHVEVVQMLPRAAGQDNSDAALLVDEDGFLFPFQVSTHKPRDTLHKSIFGQQFDLTHHAHPLQPDLFGFGSLTNYCAGVAVLEDKSTSVSPHLLTIGMDSAGVLYKDPDTALPFDLPQDEAAQTASAQLINPPLPNCVAAVGAHVAVGKANGVYSIFELDADSELNERLLAPGDAMNGLVYVDWVGGSLPQSLMTLSLCGDVTVWGVGAFLAADAEDDAESDGTLPEVQAALSLREFLGPAGKTVYANTCCALSHSTRYVLGDTSGHVLLFDVGQAK